MKSVFAMSMVVIAGVCLVPMSAMPNEFFESYAFGKFYVVTIPDDALQRTPAWMEHAENPPLPAHRARKLATQMKESLVEDGDGYKWRLRSLALYPLDDNPFEPPTDKWFWVATFWAMKVEGAATGRPHELQLVILMDGTVIKPDIRPWRPVKEEANGNADKRDRAK